MTQRITRAHLDAKVRAINSLTGSPAEPYTDRKSNKGNYHISQAYGGYSLHRMCNESGGVSDVFSIGHVSARELAGLLSAYTAGIYDATRSAA